MKKIFTYFSKFVYISTDYRGLPAARLSFHFLAIAELA